MISYWQDQTQYGKLGKLAKHKLLLHSAHRPSNDNHIQRQHLPGLSVVEGWSRHRGLLRVSEDDSGRGQ